MKASLLSVSERQRLEQMRANVDEGGKLSHGIAVELLALIERLAPPQCEAMTAPKWYRPEGGRCPYRAVTARHGLRVCRIHHDTPVLAKYRVKAK